MAKNQLTANEFTNVKDIKDIYLYTKNGYIFCYLKVYPYNIDLLSREEIEAKTNILSRSFDSDRKDFVYFSLPREIDLERYKAIIKKKYNSCISDFGRKHILSEMIMQATELESNGENYEHQQFIKIWRYIGTDQKEAERTIRTRINEFNDRFNLAGIRTEILRATDIIKMCNLFGNSVQAPYDAPISAFSDDLIILK